MALLNLDDIISHKMFTPEQQQKYDAMKKAHQDMANAMQEMHDTQKK